MSIVIVDKLKKEIETEIQEIPDNQKSTFSFCSLAERSDKSAGERLLDEVRRLNPHLCEDIIARREFDVCQTYVKGNVSKYIAVCENEYKIRCENSHQEEIARLKSCENTHQEEIARLRRELETENQKEIEQLKEELKRIRAENERQTGEIQSLTKEKDSLELKLENEQRRLCQLV
jgi:septal ring factor EnvC (AmiA/AmiB activator)